MATVFIPPQLRDLTDGASQVETEGRNVGQLIDRLESQFSGIRARLCRDGQLSPSLQVSVDNVMSSRGLFTKVQPDSEVHFLPAIGGG
mgnify:CR=1 FL=1